MPERSENETRTAGQHAAVAAWSAKARLGILILVIGVAAAMTALIVTNATGDARTITTSNAPGSSTTTPSPPSEHATLGLGGSGIGGSDAMKHGRTAKAGATLSANTSLAAFAAGAPSQGTTPAAPRSSSSAPPPSPKPSPVKSTSTPPTPTPTPTPRCRLYIARHCVIK